VCTVRPKNVGTTSDEQNSPLIRTPPRAKNDAPPYFNFIFSSPHVASSCVSVPFVPFVAVDDDAMYGLRQQQPSPPATTPASARSSALLNETLDRMLQWLTVHSGSNVHSAWTSNDRKVDAYWTEQNAASKTDHPNTSFLAPMRMWGGNRMCRPGETGTGGDVEAGSVPEVD
jgi:hypothetical protein